MVIWAVPSCSRGANHSVAGRVPVMLAFSLEIKLTPAKIIN
jgi:hypothetical protein